MDLDGEFSFILDNKLRRPVCNYELDLEKWLGSFQQEKGCLSNPWPPSPGHTHTHKKEKENPKPPPSEPNKIK